jgi:hypothetical protein
MLRTFKGFIEKCPDVCNKNEQEQVFCHYQAFSQSPTDRSRKSQYLEGIIIPSLGDMNVNGSIAC